eukprot:TRINITY_DN32698_c0_g2_i1.p1 TRINITY_DN32698_c0_g2~~TRINITY_DN32698_c0_g2_i1.p1  ORF type:complete len:588 (+),score=173.95 TRINITY_DN32698_c0_g2_i1:193-1956(+)
MEPLCHESCAALEHLVRDSRELLLFENAEFYAERLFEGRKDARSLSLLGSTVMLGGDIEAAVRLMRDYFPFAEHFHSEQDVSVLPELYRVFGTCLYRTNRLHEAEVSFRYALQYQQHLSLKEKSACLYHLGVIHSKTNREGSSTDAVVESITAYPFNWKAVETYAQGKPDRQVIDRLYASSRVSDCQRAHFAPKGRARGSSLAAQHRATVSPTTSLPCTPPSAQLLGDSPQTMPVSPVHGPSAGVTDAGVSYVMSMMHALARIVCSASAYLCDDVVAQCRRLPQTLLKTGFVQGILGTAFYDEGCHSKAAECFELMRRLTPTKIDGKLALYSSCLWQQQREKDLAHLAQEAVQMNKLSLVTQIIMGNAHSIAGDHENALQFFARGCQVDPYSAYANTLRGMEHLVLEELDEASQAFRAALRLDTKHYPAWHGLGSVASKQEKWGDAVVHFERACKINSNPPLLLAYANALMAEGRGHCLRDALATINRVLEKQPTHAFALLRKGELLMQQIPERLEEARDIALTLYELAPNEAKANLLLGRVYRRLGDVTKAQQYYNNALVLDPRDTPALKYEADRLQDSGDSDDMS